MPRLRLRRGKISAHSVRLAVPEKIFALLACSIFSTAADAPPRCICHRQRSAPHPTHRDPFYDSVPCRLSASQSFIKGSGRYACRRGGTFAPPKVPKSVLGQAPRHPRSSGATCATIGQTLRYTTGSPLRCGAPSSPHKVLRPCRGPKSPLGKPKDGFPKRGLNGAYKGLWAHLPPSPPLPRSGEGGSYSTFCLSQFSAWQVPTAMDIRRKLT